MKILRTVNRRDFHVEQAGYYQLMKPSARFVAWHLRRVFPYLERQTKAIQANEEGSPELQGLAQTGSGGTLDRRGRLRWALIVLAAIAITLGWLFGSPLPWRELGPWPH